PLISIVNTPRKVQKAIPSSNGAINVSPDYIEEEQKKKQKDLTFEKDIPLNKKMKEKTTSLTPKEMRKEFIEKTLSKLKMTKSNAGTHSFYTFPRKSFPGYFYIVRTKKDEFYLRSVIKIKTSSKPKKLYLVGGLQGYEIKLDGKNQYLSNGFFTKDILIKDSEIEAFEKIFSRDFVQAVYRKNGRNKMANFTENTQIEILSILNIYKSLLTVY
ncbi:MAG: hypothetical protein OIF32_07300, partial [Campylobacterales bacterium]|nr:hypothetical protein [Campylobacterales bacterium]